MILFIKYMESIIILFINKKPYKKANKNIVFQFTL